MPNDPELKKLTPSQIAWCVGNLDFDIEREEEAMKNAMGEKTVKHEAEGITFEDLMEIAKNKKR